MKIHIGKGKFYKAETGEKVGPMSLWLEGASHPWEQMGGSKLFCEGGDIWRDDGSSWFRIPALVEEWKDK